MIHQNGHTVGARPARDKTYGESVHNFSRTLRQPADPRGVPRGGRGAFNAKPRPLTQPQRSSPGASASKSAPLMAQPMPGAAAAQPPKRSAGAGDAVQAAVHRPKTCTEARPVAPVVARRAQSGVPTLAADPLARAAAPQPQGADLALNAGAVVFHPAPAPLSLPLHPPVTRALAQPPNNPEARKAEVLLAAGRNATKACSGAHVDVRNCSFLRKVVTRAPGGLLATFDLACAAVATVATFGYANKVLAVAWRNLKDAVGDPLVPQPAESVDPTAPTAGEFASRADAAPKSRADQLVDKLQQARQKLRVADEQAQVKSAALWGYRRRLAVLGAGTIGLGIAVATTVLSGGATLAIPGLVMATLLVRNYVANARCARANHLAAQNDLRQLPMGNSALNNALYRQYMASGKCTDAEARLKAAKVGGSVSTAINLALVGTYTAGVVAGAAVVRAATWLCNGMRGTRLVTSATQGILAPGYELLRGRHDRGQEALRRDQATQAAEQAWNQFLQQACPPQSGAGQEASADPAGNAEPGNVASRMATLSRPLAVWSLQSGKLDDLPDFLSKDGWLAGIDSASPDQVGKEQSLLSQAQAVTRELRLREQVADTNDGAAGLGVGLSMATWTGSAAAFAMALS